MDDAFVQEAKDQPGIRAGLEPVGERQVAARAAAARVPATAPCRWRRRRRGDRPRPVPWTPTSASPMLSKPCALASSGSIAATSARTWNRSRIVFSYSRRFSRRQTTSRCARSAAASDGPSEARNARMASRSGCASVGGGISPSAMRSYTRTQRRNVSASVRSLAEGGEIEPADLGRGIVTIGAVSLDEHPLRCRPFGGPTSGAAQEGGRAETSDQDREDRLHWPLTRRDSAFR